MHGHPSSMPSKHIIVCWLVLHSRYFCLSCVQFQLLLVFCFSGDESGLDKGKDDEEEELPDLSFLELLKLNIPDWHLLILGIIGSALVGALFPSLSIIFSEALDVSARSLGIEIIYLEIACISKNITIMFHIYISNYRYGAAQTRILLKRNRNTLLLDLWEWVFLP